MVFVADPETMITRQLYAYPVFLALRFHGFEHGFEAWEGLCFCNVAGLDVARRVGAIVSTLSLSICCSQPCMANLARFRFW